MKYYTPNETAIRWGISGQMVRRYCKEGRIPGAISGEDGWLIPETADRPGSIPGKSTENSPLLKKILYQKARNNHFGVYEYIQVNAAYSSCRMASNRLTRVQVQGLYRTDRIYSSGEPATVDDVIEVINHFTAMDTMLETVRDTITQAYCKKIHQMLSYGTFFDRDHSMSIGTYRRNSTKIHQNISTRPESISPSLTSLFKEYEKSPVTLEHILDFHVRFERIRPFDDFNGRLGRLLMLKECLRNNITPLHPR